MECLLLDLLTFWLIANARYKENRGKYFITLVSFRITLKDDVSFSLKAHGIRFTLTVQIGMNNINSKNYALIFIEQMILVGYLSC